MRVEDFSCVACACAAILSVCTITAYASDEVVIDLNGGYLFGTDVPPAPGVDLIEYNLTVPFGENKRVINGDMLGGIQGSWDETYSIVVDGELHFGPQFPNDNVFLGDAWLFTVNGILSIDDLYIDAPVNAAGRFVVSNSGVLNINEDKLFRSFANIKNNGHIVLGDSSRLAMFSESKMLGTGTVAMGVNSSFSGFAFGGLTFILSKQSVMDLGWVNGITIHFPISGSARVSLVEQIGGFVEIVNGQIFIHNIPPSNSEPSSIILGSQGFDPLRNCTIELTTSDGAILHEAQLVLAMPPCTECHTPLSSNTLVPPTSQGGEEFVLRWGLEGLYLLTVPLDWCQADLNFDGQLNFFDISEFINAYLSQSAWANLTVDQEFNFFDVSAYLELYNSGCP